MTRTLPYPPAYGGDVLYTAGLIESLAAAGARLTVVCRAPARASAPEVRGVEWQLDRTPEPWRTRALLGRAPSIVSRSRSPAMERLVRALPSERRFDVVVFDNLAMGWALGPVLDAVTGDERPALVYVSHNHEASLRREVAKRYAGNPAAKLVLALDAARACRLERRLSGAADLVTANTDEDAARFRADAPDQRLLVVTPGYGGTVNAGRVINERTPRRAIVLGSFGWLAKQMNLVSFLNAAAGPFSAAGVDLLVAGAMPDGALGRFRRRYPSVTFTGPVEEVDGLLETARLAIVPEETGGGFKHKLLRLVFAGVPVVALRQALPGVRLVDGYSVLARDDMASLVQASLSAIDDVRLLNHLRQNAFVSCEGRFDWRDRGSLLVSALQDLRPAGTERLAV